MKTYRIEYTGFVIVEAEDACEALDKADNDEEIYEEYEWKDPVEVDDITWG